MRRNKLGINTFFGLSYFVFSFLGALIPDHPRNQGQFFDRSSANRIEFSLGANPIGQVNPTADNSSCAGSPESGPGNVSFISTKPTKLPIQGTTLVPPTYSESGRGSVGSSGMFINNVSCPQLTSVSPPSDPRQYCSESNIADLTPTNDPTGTTYTWKVVIDPSDDIRQYIPNAVDQTTPQQIINSTTFLPKLKNITNTTKTITYEVTPNFAGTTSSSCTNPQPFLMAIKIAPKPYVSNLETIYVCSGVPIAWDAPNGGINNNIVPDLSSVPNSTSYRWSIINNSGSVGNVNNSSGAGTWAVFTGTVNNGGLTNNSNTQKTVTYLVTPFSGSCQGADFTLTVVVDPTPKITDQNPVEICSGSRFTVIPSASVGDIIPSGTSNGVTYNTSYTWTVVPNPDVVGESDQNTGQSSISQTLTNPSNRYLHRKAYFY